MRLFLHDLPRRVSALVALVAIAITAGEVRGQDARDSTRLPEVVVTADRIPLPVSRTTSAVTIITGESLRAAGVEHVLDALRFAPSIGVVRAGSAGAQTALFMRGGESDYVRVLVDGVPMNDPGGAIDLGALTTDNVERIEIVRGPASVLYGSDAVSGVVQIFTRRAAAPVEGRLAARAGSYGTSVVDGSLASRTARGALSLGLSRHASDGVLAFNNQYRNTVGSARGELFVPGGTRVGATLRHSDNTFHYPTDGSGAVVDRNARRSDRRLAASAEIGRDLGERVDALLTVGALESHGRTSDPQDSPADTSGFFAYRSTGVVRRRNADLRFNVRPAPGQTLTLGAEYAGEAQRSADSSNYDTARNRFAACRITRAAYGQLVGERGRVSYSLGGRYDDNDVYGAFRTARGGAAVALWRGARVRASYGTSFKAPTFLETFTTAFTVGNTALRPERSRGWEGALAQSFADGDVDLSATWFDQRFRDLIQYTFRAPGDPNYFNVARASARGVEVEARVRPASGLEAWGGVTALRTRVEDAGFQEGAGATFVRGERLLRRAPLTTTIGASVQRIPRTRLELSALHVAARDDRDFSGFPARPVELDAYTRVDAAAEFRLAGDASGGLWKRAALTVRVENAFGARYDEVYGFAAPGRALLAGFSFGTVR